MSPRSRANGSVSSGKSGKKQQIDSFLNRNFYSIKERKQEEINKAKTKYDQYENQKRQQEFNQWGRITSSPGRRE